MTPPYVGWPMRWARATPKNFIHYALTKYLAVRHDGLTPPESDGQSLYLIPDSSV